MHTSKRDSRKSQRERLPARLKEVKVKEEPKEAKMENAIMTGLIDSLTEIKIQLTKIQAPRRNAPPLRLTRV